MRDSGEALRQQVDAFILQMVRDYMDDMSMDFLVPEMDEREFVKGIMNWVTEDFVQSMLTQLCKLLDIEPSPKNILLGWNSYRESRDSDIHMVDIWMFNLIG